MTYAIYYILYTIYSIWINHSMKYFLWPILYIIYIWHMLYSIYVFVNIIYTSYNILCPIPHNAYTLYITHTLCYGLYISMLYNTYHRIQHMIGYICYVKMHIHTLHKNYIPLTLQPQHLYHIICILSKLTHTVI